MEFLRASACSGSNGCIEVRLCCDECEVMILRDSDNPRRVIATTKEDFAKFLDGAKKGEFDHLVTTPTKLDQS